MSNEIAKTNDSMDMFTSESGFNLASRMSAAMAKSTVIPTDYQGNPSNCLIALSMAARLNADPMMVMQNLYIVHGRPSWSSSYIIGMINSSGRYKSEMQFEFSGKKGTPEYGCTAYVIKNDDTKLTGPIITMAMAQAEGWTSRSGSKWKTMPEIMLRYRAASFFSRLYCSDLLMGFLSDTEAQEIVVEPEQVQANAKPLTFEQPAQPVIEQAVEPVAVDVTPAPAAEPVKAANPEEAPF